MERIQSINPQRIAWCCADQGISLGELAAEVGVGEASISRAMEGKDSLTFNQLRKIADYFGRGVLFFLEAGPVDVAHVRTPAFRTLANQKPEITAKIKTLIERVEKQRLVYLSLREDLDEADRPTFDPPQLHRLDPKKAARIARKWLKLTDRNTFDTYRAAVEARGVLVFRSNGYSGKWQIAKNNPTVGFSLYDAICPVIVVKKQPWEAQQAFTLLHELGHLLLHKESSIDEEQDIYSHQGRERDANAFAGNVLVPDEFLRSILDAGRPADESQFDLWLKPQRNAWGVSGEVILRRLMDAGRLPASSYTAYRQWRSEVAPVLDAGGNRMYRHREPKHIFGDTFVHTVLDALSARHITLAKASTYLDGLKISDLHQLESHFAGV